MVVAILLPLAGCVSDQFTASLSQFQSTTSTAVDVQKAQIATIQSQDATRIRNALAVQKVALRPSAACADLIGSDRNIGECQLVGPEGAPIESAVNVANILALGQSLNDYAKALSVLAADTSSDGQAFSKSLSTLAEKVGVLDGAVAKVSNTTGLPQKQLNAVATIISQAGNLYFEARRVAVLRRIVIATDPFVKEATFRLAGTDDALRTGLTNVALRDLNRASDTLSNAIASGAPVTEIKARQAAVFDAMDAYKQRAASTNSFLQLGEAHAHLARAAAAGAQGPELFAAILRLADTAKTISQSAETLRRQ
jgi:hypothetical protein